MKGKRNITWVQPWRLNRAGMAALLLFLLCLLGSGERAGRAAPLAQDSAPPGAPEACSAIGGFSKTAEGTHNCVYYNTGSQGDISSSDATTTASYLDQTWNAYTSTAFGFNAPNVSGKLPVEIKNSWSSGSCTAYAWYKGSSMGGYTAPFDFMELYSMCYQYAGLTYAWSSITHELFHFVQYTYDTNYKNHTNIEWVYDGTAQLMQDNSFSALDTWSQSASWPGAYNYVVNEYMANPNHDLTSYTARYQSELWWKYFSEQFGKVTTEPQRGVDAVKALWQSINTSSDIAAINAAITKQGFTSSFEKAFKQFTVANWTHNLTSLPNASYYYVDEKQGGPAYGTIKPASGGTINSSTGASWSGEKISRYGAKYYSAQIGSPCPVITAAFSRSSNTDAFYHLIGQKGSGGAAFSKHLQGSGATWNAALINESYTRVTAIVGSLPYTSTVSLSLACISPKLQIDQPVSGAPAYVGLNTAPGKFLAKVLVTNGSGGPVTAGLSKDIFSATVNGKSASIVAGGFIQQEYWLQIQAPTQSANGTYNLVIALKTSGGTILASATSSASVVYDAKNGDQVLIIDRSGSMGAPSDYTRLKAAQDAANLYVDVSRTNDGLAVVNFDDVANSPAPLQMAKVTAAVRTAAKTYINALTARNFTSFGAGMNQAYDQRKNHSTGNARCSFVLLSDGKENTAPMWADVKANIQSLKCPVTSVAFGPAADKTLMESIAKDTGGTAFYNDVYVDTQKTAAAPHLDTWQAMDLGLGNTFEFAQEKSEDRQRLLAEEGQIPLGVTPNTHTVLVDEGVSEALFTLDWTGIYDARLRLDLVTPGGLTIAPETVPYDYYDEESMHLGWRILDPQPGTWQMVVSFEGGDDDPVHYQVLVSGLSSLTLDLLLPDRVGGNYLSGNRIPINALLSTDEGPLTGFMVEALVTNPSGVVTWLRLYDDGLHQDGGAEDGLYGNLFTRMNETQIADEPGEDGAPNPTPTKNEGTYSVKAIANSDHFQRQALGSFSVLASPDDNGNGLPDTFEREYGVSDPFADPDGDGILNNGEYWLGTDPLNSDTDGGGENDGSEALVNGSDPLDPADDHVQPPQFVQARPGNGIVVLTYDVQPGYDHLSLFRSQSGEGPWERWVDVLPPGGVFTDTVENGGTFFYQVEAMAPGGYFSGRVGTPGVTPSEDPVAPEAWVVVNHGAEATPSLMVVLTFWPYRSDLPGEPDSFSDIEQVMLANTPDFEDATWQPFSQEIPWRMAAPQGGTTAQVYARFKDGHGNQSVVAVGTIQYLSQRTFVPFTALRY
jgi:Mg-chelatase subunit ChlD